MGRVAGVVVAVDEVAVALDAGLVRDVALGEDPDVGRAGEDVGGVRTGAARDGDPAVEA
jgi:hypothetical protein